MSDSFATTSPLFSPIRENPLRLANHVHPFPELLALSPEEILAKFQEEQRRDFLKIIHSPDLSDIKIIKGASTGKEPPQTLLPDPDAIERLFLDLHEHVMSHPVWLHPFFTRIFRGEFNLEQLRAFALQYFNQIKNTRQCVALALGRFSGFSDRRHGPWSERISEITQIVLAQLVADEYGVSTHSIEEYPGLSGIFGSTTHIVMYRQLFEGLGIPFELQDRPMIHGVADNVAVQRILAGSPAFDELEALASVGLGMEWGVPEFFSLLLGGFIRFAANTNTTLTEAHLLVFIAHVKYDVMHAISVMYVTALHMDKERDLQKVKNATNTLMAARYGMMDALYRHVFKEDPPPVHFETKHKLTDRRIVSELRASRSLAREATVEEVEKYKNLADTPFQFV